MIYVLLPQFRTSDLQADLQQLQLDLRQFASQTQQRVAYSYYKGGLRLFGVLLCRAARVQVSITPGDDASGGMVTLHLYLLTRQYLDGQSRERWPHLDEVMWAYR